MTVLTDIYNDHLIVLATGYPDYFHFQKGIIYLTLGNSDICSSWPSTCVSCPFDSAPACSVTAHQHLADKFSDSHPELFL